jgi:hypothetical protein
MSAARSPKGKPNGMCVKMLVPDAGLPTVRKRPIPVVLLEQLVSPSPIR